MSNIIVVDDEESIRSLCAVELAEEGYEVITTWAVGVGIEIRCA